MSPIPYVYRVELRRVVDGDTVVLDLDMGFKCWLSGQYVRLYDVDTPEIFGRNATPEGQAAKAFTVQWFREGATFTMISRRYDHREKYGRILGDIHRDDDPISLNQALLAAGHVKT